MIMKCETSGDANSYDLQNVDSQGLLPSCVISSS